MLGEDFKGLDTPVFLAISILIDQRTISLQKDFFNRNFDFSVRFSERLAPSTAPTSLRTNTCLSWPSNKSSIVPGHSVSLREQKKINFIEFFGYRTEVNGCSGGNDVAVYKYAMQAGGLALEEDYGSYLGVDGKCHASDVKKTVKVTNWVNVTQYNIEDMKRALVENGPVTIAIK